jgi:molybdopterin-biosynthesis enzyme MoeA-like protein
VGTAAGYSVDAAGASVYVMPGTPMELQPMLANHVLPRVQEIFGRPPLRIERFRTTGIAESQLF